MISIDEIDKAILDLEQHDTTYATCEKLAWLYIVKDHLKNAPQCPNRLNNYEGNDFMRSVSNKPTQAVFEVLSEHFDVLQVICPKEYKAVIKKIEECG